MIPLQRLDVLEAGHAVLQDFARRSGARGRLIALYLGLRRMGGQLASLGDEAATPSSSIEQFMDALLIKTHRAEPFVVLTAPFGGSPSPTAPYSTRTGEIAPGHHYATNTWRNNFGIQKGVGCPAEPETILALLADPRLRLACPHMAEDPEGRHVCSLEGTSYRGEEHSIWLRKAPEGWQKTDLDDPATYQTYLEPHGEQVPVFALLAVLYCDSAEGVYPEREVVGVPDFAADFGFTVRQVEEIFNCAPDHSDNAAVLQVATNQPLAAPPASEKSTASPSERSPQPLPDLVTPMLANSGLGAELAVAADLRAQGWQVAYRGGQVGMGYDLEAERDGVRLRVEVKSSIGPTSPELTESEWAAAREHRDSFVLAIVDFYGGEQPVIWYVRDPASTATPSERTTTSYRLSRSDLEPMAVEAEIL